MYPFPSIMSIAGLPMNSYNIGRDTKWLWMFKVIGYQKDLNTKRLKTNVNPMIDRFITHNMRNCHQENDVIFHISYKVIKL